MKPISKSGEAKGTGETKPNSPRPAESKVVTIPQAAAMTDSEKQMLAPPPDILEHEAEQEPNRRLLRDYFGAIRTLREKGFSFRDIAEWLTERGVEADHNAVYRVFTRKITPMEDLEEQEREREEAEDEALNQ